MNFPLVSIITVNYRQPELTCEMLRSLQTDGWPNLEVLLVDNAATDDQSAIFGAAFPGVRVFTEAENLGFAGGNNIALAEAKGAFLFLLNNDATIEPGGISALVARLQNPKIGAVSPKISYFGTDLIQFAGFSKISRLTGRNRAVGKNEPDLGQHDEARETAYGHGAALMLRRDVFEKTGPMPEEYFLYYEEMDWCERIRRAGFDIWFEPAARVWHRASASTEAESPFQLFWLTRNRILFMRRWAGRFSFAVFGGYFSAVSLARAAGFLFSGRKKRAAAIARGWLAGFQAK